MIKDDLMIGMIWGEKGFLMGDIHYEGQVQEERFKEIISNTIVPFYRIVQNQGFGLWGGV